MTRVPDGWELTTVDGIKADVNYACTGGPFGSDLTAKDYVDAPGVPVIRGANLSGKESRWSDHEFVYVSEEKADELATCLARPGDFIFTQRGTIGQVARIPEEVQFERFVISQSQMKLTVASGRVNPRYLEWYFRSATFREYLSQATLQTGVPHINLGILRRAPVLYPRSQEQQSRIADLLDQADVIRRQRCEAIELTDDLLRATFLEMFGDPLSNPKAWPVAKMGGLLREPPRNGTVASAHGEGRYRVARVGEVGAWNIAVDSCGRVDLSGPDLERFCLADGDIVLARAIGSESHLGKASIVSGLRDVLVFDSHLMRVRSDPSEVLPDFLLAWLKSKGGRSRFMQRAARTAVQFNVNAKQFNDIDVPVPPLALQQEFVLLLAGIRDNMRRMSEGAGRVDSLFTALQDRAFRGGL